MLKCHAAAWSLRASHLNWALVLRGKVGKSAYNYCEFI